jgi:magnesium-transporting ATPase (P-type)
VQQLLVGSELDHCFSSLPNEDITPWEITYSVNLNGHAVIHQLTFMPIQCTRVQGTLIVAGRARGIIVGTGSSTAIGKIRDALSDQVRGRE